jgi:hypothetical protein
MNGIFVFYLQLGLDFGSDLRILSFSVPEQSYKAHDKKKTSKSISRNSPIPLAATADL